MSSLFEEILSEYQTSSQEKRTAAQNQFKLFSSAVHLYFHLRTEH